MYSNIDNINSYWWEHTCTSIRMDKQQLCTHSGFFVAVVIYLIILSMNQVFIFFMFWTVVVEHHCLTKLLIRLRLAAKKYVCCCFVYFSFLFVFCMLGLNPDGSLLQKKMVAWNLIPNAHRCILVWKLWRSEFHSFSLFILNLIHNDNIKTSAEML